MLSQEPRIRLLGTYNGEFSRLNAESILDDCLNVYPDLHGVICQNDLMAEGCYQALVRRGWPERWLWWASTASVLWWRRSPLAA